MRFVFIAAMLFVVPLCAAASEGSITGTASANELRTVETLDVSRFMGRWYEIARFPNRFQKKCRSDTTADYSLGEDGRVEVTNRCKTHDGTISSADGVARQVGDETSPKLQVRFAPAWLSFIPAVWGNYWIIDLDKAYSLAVVSEPTREYLWILAREPVINEEEYEVTLRSLEQRGFDVDKLLRSHRD